MMHILQGDACVHSCPSVHKLLPHFVSPITLHAAFPESISTLTTTTTAADQASTASSSTGDLADLFFSSQSAEQPDREY